MQVTLPLAVVVAQWTLLAALTLLVVVVYRQMAFLLELRGRAKIPEGLSEGTRAPEFEYIPATMDGDHNVRNFQPTGRWTVLMFSDPLCSSCDRALTALAKVLDGRRERPRALVVTTAEPQLVASVESFRRSPMEVGRVDHEVHHAYRTEVTPYFYVIDPNGVIRSRGAVDTAAGIELLLSKAHRHGTATEMNGQTSEEPHHMEVKIDA